MIHRSGIEVGNLALQDRSNVGWVRERRATGEREPKFQVVRWCIILLLISVSFLMLWSQNGQRFNRDNSSPDPLLNAAEMERPALDHVGIEVARSI